MEVLTEKDILYRLNKNFKYYTVVSYVTSFDFTLGYSVKNCLCHSLFSPLFTLNFPCFFSCLLYLVRVEDSLDFGFVYPNSGRNPPDQRPFCYISLYWSFRESFFYQKNHEWLSIFYLSRLPYHFSILYVLYCNAVLNCVILKSSTWLFKWKYNALEFTFSVGAIAAFG